MKRFVAILLAVLMLMSLTACGTKKNAEIDLANASCTPPITAVPLKTLQCRTKTLLRKLKLSVLPSLPRAQCNFSVPED